MNPMSLYFSIKIGLTVSTKSHLFILTQNILIIDYFESQEYIKFLHSFPKFEIFSNTRIDSFVISEYSVRNKK